MSIVGYARVSTLDQRPELQTDALKLAKCERIFEDKASGSKVDRPQLTACLDYLRAGDALVIWKLDRLGRNLSHLLKILDDLNSRGVELVIITMGVDTRTPAGKLFYSVFAAFAEYERALIRERTNAGLAAARARGRVGGRPRALSKRQAGALRGMYAEVGADGKRAHTVAAIAREFGISRPAVYRYLEAS